MVILVCKVILWDKRLKTLSRDNVHQRGASLKFVELGAELAESELWSRGRREEAGTDATGPGFVVGIGGGIVRTGIGLTGVEVSRIGDWTVVTGNRKRGKRNWLSSYYEKYT